MADAPAEVRDAAADPSAPPRRRTVAVVGGVAALAFAVLTLLVVADVTQGIDDRAAAAASDEVREILLRPTKVTLHLLDPRVSIALAVIVGVSAFALTSRSRDLGRALAVIGVWGAITLAVKVVLDRPLPNAGSGAYPSGHVGGAVVVCAIAGLALVELLPAGRWRQAAVVVLAAVPISLAVLLVASGGHWLTDVAGGALLAVACLAAGEVLVVRRA